MSNRRFDIKDESPVLFLTLGAVIAILTGFVLTVVVACYFLLGLNPHHNFGGSATVGSAAQLATAGAGIITPSSADQPANCPVPAK